MRGWRSRDHNSVDSSEHLIKLTCCLRGWIRSLSLCDPLGILVDNGDLDTRHAAEYAHVLRAPVAVAHYRHADVGIEGCDVPGFTARGVGCWLGGSCNELHRDGPPAVTRDVLRQRTVAKHTQRASTSS